MKKYKKKPIVIEAEQLKIPNKKGEVAYQFHMGTTYATFEDEKGYHVFINTLEGQMRCDNGDYIIKGVQGEFYPCKPDIFELTYEEVT